LKHNEEKAKREKNNKVAQPDVDLHCPLLVEIDKSSTIKHWHGEKNPFLFFFSFFNP